MDIQTIFTSIQPEIFTIIISAAVAGAGYLYQWGVQRLPNNAQTIINSLAQIATQAIEQKYTADNPGGALKKQEAMKILANMCQELGLAFNKSHASAAIEAAVYMMNLYKQWGNQASAGRAIADKDTKAVPIVPALTLPSKAASGNDAAK